METSIGVPALEAQAQGTFFEIGSLLAALAHLTDQRSARGVRYDLAPVLVLMVLAKLAGQDRPSGIAHWISLRAAWLIKALGLRWKRTPHDATYRRVMASAINVGELEGRGQPVSATCNGLRRTGHHQHGWQELAWNHPCGADARRASVSGLPPGGGRGLMADRRREQRK